MITVDAKDITFNTDNSYNSIKVEIDPKYEAYIRQLEEEVKELREIVRMAHEYFNYFHNGEIIKFPKSPPQTPRWSI